MRTQGFTEEQRAVIDSSTARLTVTAAAGSGKTKTLVDRYLRYIIDKGLRPDQVLTVTFTRKAAAEMKHRIVNVLRDNGMMVEAQIAETGPIQTLHSFCERVLRENAFDAGIDPAFEVAAAEFKSAADRALKRVIERELDKLPEALELVKGLVGKQGSLGEWSWLTALMDNSLAEAVDSVRSSGLDLDEIERRHSTPEAVERTWKEVLLRRMSPSERDEYGGLTFAELTSKAKSVPGWRSQEWVKGSRAHHPLDSIQTCGFAQLLAAVCRDMECEMLRLQRFDFCLLESLTVRLVAQSEEVRKRLNKQYKVVLVDESQDLNPVQYHLLDSLGIEDEMMVGDPQQSIYGFRHADRELFVERTRTSKSLRLTRNFRSVEGIQHFVDRLFQDLWQGDYMPMLHGLESEDRHDPFAGPTRHYSGVEFWNLRGVHVPAIARLISEMIERGECSARDIAVLCRTNAKCQEFADALQKHDVLTRIAGGSERFYTRLEVHDLANSLQALTDPSDDFALLAMLRSPVVGLSLDSMVALAGPGLDERLGAAELPHEEDRHKLEQFLSWYRPLAGYAERMPAWSVIATVIKDSPLMDNLARTPGRIQAIANVRKLLMLAVSEREMGPMAFAENIRTIQSFLHKEGEAPIVDPEADVVTLMTIHKAKGLEFPVVVIPDLNRKQNFFTKKAYVGVRDTVLATMFDKKLDKGRSPLAYAVLKAEDQAKEMHERWRVVYVAMTRAKQRLCLVVDLEQAKGNTMAYEIVRRFCAGGKPIDNSFVIREPAGS